MKHRGIRLFGTILLILSVLALLAGAAGRTMERENGLGHALYLDATAAQRAISEAQKALAELEELTGKLQLRADAAANDAQAALEAADAVRNAADTGDFGGDLAELGDALYGARDAEGVDEAFAAYLTVYGSEARAAIDTATQSLNKICKTISQTGDACAALQAAAGALGEGAFPELPETADVALTEPADLSAQAQQLVDGASAAQSAVDALLPVAEAHAAEARALLSAHPLGLIQSCAFLAQARATDILVIGGALLLVALALLVFPDWVAGKWKLRLFRSGTYLVIIVILLALALRYAPGDTWALMRQGVLDTLYMTIPSTIAAYVLGLPLGVLLVITAAGHIRPNPSLNAALGTAINFLRSIPFVILLVMLFDVTRIVMGTAIGTRSIIFPLFVSAFPYVARMVEGSLNEVDHGVIEAAESMGSSTWQIIRKVLLPEALPSLINGAAICTTTILAYTAMAGAAGGDGLGKIAITYGLNYRDYEVMYIASLLLVALVQIIQIAGDILTRAFDHRKK